MKISEMNNDQACDCLLRMAQPVSNIMDDEDFQPMMTKLSEYKDATVIKAIADMLPKIVTISMKNHRNDLYEIVGALTFKSADEVGTLKFIWTVKQLRDSLDKDLIDFFKSSGSVTEVAGK